MRPIFSIVVPVFNVENHLTKCIKSLVSQTYTQIEILLIDDGSTDASSGMCDSFAKSDPRIRTIHKLNGGLSDARNLGIREAKGKYILFVDSDDFIEEDTCERLALVLCNSTQNPDVVVGNAIKITGNNIIFLKHKLDTLGNMISGPSYLKNELASKTMFMAAWLNLYRRDFLVENLIFFKYGLLHEDEEFTPRVFLKAKNVIGTSIIFYNYVIRDGSITTHKDKLKNAEDIMRTLSELEVIYNNIEDAYLRALLNDNLVDKFLSTFQAMGLYKRKYAHLVNEKFLNNKAYTSRNKLRVFLFNISKSGYYFLNNYMRKCSRCKR